MKEFDFGEIEVADKGAYFIVFMFPDHVVKIPKRSKFHKKKNKKRKEDLNETLSMIAEVQSYLAERVEGVLPCWKVNNYLVMPRAPGLRGDKLTDEQWERASEIRDCLLEQIKEHGYVLQDAGKDNIHYDPETDKVYLIDFHLIKGK